MKTGPDRRYTAEFRDAAVRQVVDAGRGVVEVAHAVEMPSKTLERWVYEARRGQEAAARAPGRALTEQEAELWRLRQENAKLKLEKEILKKAAAYFARESL
jgi:transposase